MKRYFSFFFFILSSLTTYSQIGNVGSCFVETYDATIYKGNNQNWSITQDNRGVMYFANTSGIITFNGSEWGIVQTASKCTVRTVEKAPDNKIYYAGKGDFGYLKSNKKGEIGVHSLVRLFKNKENVEISFMKLCSTTQGEYVFLPNQILFYNHDSISNINFQVAGMFGFVINDHLFAINKKGGIYFFDKGKNTLLPGTKDLTLNGGRTIILKYDDNNLLIIVQNRGMFKYKIGEYFNKKTKRYNFDNDSIDFVLTRFSTGFDKYLKLNMCYSGTKINDSIFGIGTIYGGLVIFNKSGKLIQIYNKNRRLLGNAITSIFVDRDSNIWVTQLKGISYINYNTKVSVFSRNEGIDGSVYFVLNNNDTIYAGTSLGLFYLPPHRLENKDDKSVFRHIKGSKSFVWDLIKIKNLIVASSSNSIFVVDGNKIVNKYDKVNGFCIEKSEKFPGYIFICRNHGFSALKYKYRNNNIELTEQIDFDNVSSSIRGMLQKDNSVWLTSSYNGVYRVKFGDDIHDYNVVHYDTVSGLPDMDNNYLMVYNDKLFSGSGKGTYIYNFDNDRFEKSNILSSKTIDSSGVFELHKFQDKLFILTAKSTFGYLVDKNNDGDFELDRGFGIKLRSYQIYSTLIDKKNILWLSTNHGVGRIDLNYEPHMVNEYNTLITKVTIGNDSVLFSGTFFKIKNKDTIRSLFSVTQPQVLVPTLDYKYNEVKFNFCSTFYEQYENNSYSYYLKGQDKEWSKWKKDKDKEYSNLREGEYTFMVKSKNCYKQESLIASYKFIIKPPWYRTWYAYFSYAILLVLLILVILKLALRRVVKAKVKLEEIIKERTAEIREKNIELSVQKDEILAQADQLEIKNRELEKLSIVACETDNSVLIMDNNGNLEWANDAFCRLYGYSLDEFKNIFGDNLVKVTSHKDIKDAVNSCISKKESVIYESRSKTKSGEVLWLQTTLTPIIDNNGNIVKLIAVETDISRLKDYEIEILQKNEEINSQNEELGQKNRLLKESNESIRASIRYALTIQKAILPEFNYIKKFFDVFILYRPKDIVSGDFYWFSHFPKSNDMPETSFVSVIDCTGHGVPGAFMSMIANTMLNQIVNEHKNFNPMKVLSMLSNSIVKALKQKSTNNQDGMDMAFVKIEKLDDSTCDITFCGAKRPLFYIKKSENITKKLKADRMSIGGIFDKKNNEFTNQSLRLESGDMIYLTTDGYIDQNNYERKRFGSLLFAKTLGEIHELSLQEQHRVLSERLDKWKGNEIQRDDIAILGLKL